MEKINNQKIIENKIVSTGGSSSAKLKALIKKNILVLK